MLDKLYTLHCRFVKGLINIKINKTTYIYVVLY